MMLIDVSLGVVCKASVGRLETVDMPQSTRFRFMFSSLMASCHSSS